MPFRAERSVTRVESSDKCLRSFARNGERSEMGFSEQLSRETSGSVKEYVEVGHADPRDAQRADRKIPQQCRVGQLEIRQVELDGAIIAPSQPGIVPLRLLRHAAKLLFDLRQPRIRLTSQRPGQEHPVGGSLLRDDCFEEPGLLSTRKGDCPPPP